MQTMPTQIILFLTSLIIVAFGQPYWSSLLSLLATIIGFALFFRFLITLNSPKQRFYCATVWFMGVQLVQLSWLLSHPYSYIIALHILLSLVLGVQFGLIGLLANPNKITSISRILLITGCWTVLEWSRLFVLSGFAFNPIGMSLSANLYTLQTASIWGVFGMSFWVLLTNLLFLKAWMEWPKARSLVLCGICAFFPFFYGYVHLKIYDTDPSPEVFNALLVQPVFPIEECMEFKDAKSFTAFVVSEWKQILELTKEHQGKNIQLIALPEFIVPFGTYTPVFTYDEVRAAFLEVFGKAQINKLPVLQEPIAFQKNTIRGPVWMVTNAYWLQAIANVFGSSIISGMEDVEDFDDGHREHYSAAQFVIPAEGASIFPLKRYDKRILVPMGEYIPFSFCRKLAASYGITGSFTPGTEAKVFDAGIPFGTSICYEETFGHIMRESRLKGARLLVNLTSDIWYPTVAQHHCDHALLRTVENGMPLIRACNTGITGAFDSHGREVRILGNTELDKIWKPGALYVQVPVISYHTLYSILGDYFIIAISFLCIVWGLARALILLINIYFT
jgi:apolipoprotein N-acyltransferase